MTSGNGRDNVPSIGYASVNNGFSFGESSLESMWDDNIPSLYGKYSAQSSEGGFGFGNQPFIEIKPNSSTFDRFLTKYDTRSAPFGSFVRDTERITKFLASGRGLLFSAKQFMLQSFNPTFETRLWNPTSILQSIVPYNNPNRHASLPGSLGFNIPFDTNRYEESLKFIPDPVIQSRVAYQSPRFSNSLSALPGLKYAEQGRDWMADAGNLKLHNPNRYDSPLLGDVGEFSSLLPGGAALEQNSALANMAVKYTKSTGYTPSTNLEISSIKNFVPGIITSIVPSAVVKHVAKIFGYGELTDLFSNNIKLFNSYNSTYKYSPGLLNNENYNVQFNVLNGEGTENSVYGAGANSISPLVDMLNSMTDVSRLASSVVKKVPYTFSDTSKIVDRLPENIDERTKLSPHDGRRVVNLVQGYSNIIAKRQSGESGNVGNGDALGLGNVAGGDKTYQQDMIELENNGDTKTVFRTYAMADSGRKTDRDKFYDKVNALNVNEDYEVGQIEDYIPFKFFNNTTNEFIIFRATIAGINDNIGADYNAKKYIGRPDKVYTYSGTNRKISFSFTIYPHSERELEPLWIKLNKLIGMCHPTYRSIGNVGKYMIPSFISLTIGDMYNDMPGILDSLSINVDDQGTWEIREDGLYPAFGENSTESFSLAKLPRLIRVSVGFTIINKTLPSTNSAFYDASFISDAIISG